MEDFERLLSRAAVKRRKQTSPPRKTAPLDPEKKRRRIDTRRQKLKELGVAIEVCPICGCDDVSKFQFDHVAGRKHHPQLWPLCENCHEEKTSMLPEEPPLTDNPHNVFEVIGRWLLGMAEYFEMLIRYLRKWGEFLIELARQGYGAELVLPT